MLEHAITDFHGEYYWLDNMFLSPIRWSPSLTFEAVEYGFVYFKLADPAMRNDVLACVNPYEAKALGRSVAMRDDWDEIKFGIMYELVSRKFNQNPRLMRKLLATGDAMLIEGNTWDDNIWGDCTCVDCLHIPGENWLGKILMSLRAQYRDIASR